MEKKVVKLRKLLFYFKPLFCLPYRTKLVKPFCKRMNVVLFAFLILYFFISRRLLFTSSVNFQLEFLRHISGLLDVHVRLGDDEHAGYRGGHRCHESNWPEEKVQFGSFM